MNFDNVVTFQISGNLIYSNPVVHTSGEYATIEGSPLYPSSYVLEITAKGAINNDSEINGAGGVIGIKVFDTNGTLVDEFLPQNPGQYASIQNGVSGVGDDYLRFNSNVLVNSQGVPFASQAIITRDPMPVTYKNGNMAYDINPLVVPCFVAGHNKIYTIKGWKYVENIRIGDLVWTLDEGFQPVTYITRHTITKPTRKQAPVAIRGMLLSRHHRIYENNYLISCIKHPEHQILFPWRESILYVNIFLEKHQILRVNGRLVESGFAGGKYANCFTDLKQVNTNMKPAREFR